MDIPADVKNGIVDDSGTLCADVACRRCGYNLRGLDPSGRCPECGTPVGLSCHGDLLRFADPAWVETLGRGASLILWGILFGLVGAILGTAVAAITGSQLLGGVIQLAGAAVGLYGAWLVTSPDPSGIGEDKYVTDRRIVRFALLVGVASQLFALIQQAMPVVGVLAVLIMLIILLAGLVGVVGEFAKLTYFEKLARRIPDAKLARDAHNLRWAMAISLGAAILFGGVAALAMVLGGTGGPGGVAVGATALGCMAGVAGLAYAVVGILVLILIYRLGRAFRQQAHIARHTWAAVTSPPPAQT